MSASEVFSRTGKRWLYREGSSITFGSAEELIASLCKGRGIETAEDRERFLSPSIEHFHDAALLPDADVAVDLIAKHRKDGNLIYVHGDYDVDGMSSTALLTRLLRKLDCKVEGHVPHRIREGYGIHQSAVLDAKEQGAKLFLTCDCGIKAFDQILLAKSLGLDVVVTDHHSIGEELPEADALVNPHRADSQYPFAELAGVGVALKLGAHLVKTLGFPLPQYYRAFLDLATLGTVGDVVPLIDENRVIVSLGLPLLSSSQKQGIQALLRRSQRDWAQGQKIGTRAVSFGLVPRLNAAGRIDDAATSFSLLLAETEAESERLASILEELNTERRTLQMGAVERAVKMVLDSGQHEDSILIVSGDWHPGVVGLVAGKLVERFYRPAIVIGAGEGGSNAKASARSIPGYHIADAFARLGHLLATHGGHEMAGGFSVEIEKLEAFKEALRADAQQNIRPETLIPTLTLDGVLAPGTTTLALADSLAQLEPYGNFHQEPTFSSPAEIVDIRPTKHEHFFLYRLMSGSQVVEGISRTDATLPNSVRKGEKVNAAFKISINEYQGRRTPQWLIEDFA